MGEPHVVSLRATRDTDLDILNLITRDAGIAAGPTSATLGSDPADRRTIRADGEIVGDVARWHEAGCAFVSYRVDGARRDDGIAGRALRLFVEVLDERPVRARVAAGDTGSIRVLERLGFEPDAAWPTAAIALGAPDDDVVYLLA
ncbi:GNAT family N-acetyltransferase [Agromyces allii]|uniref:N-acetyltransferase domain-containing protein n=1 Tax=Agromyces allii TaxID=393607 RepID=A0ABN2Q6L4_9MICO|nr:GNAT family protein [Agromyces allii]